MTDYNDNLILRATYQDPSFQLRCRLRFINAALAVAAEELTFYASAAQSSGTTITFASAPTGVATGMYAENLTTSLSIPHFLTVSSVAGSVVTMSGTVTGLITNDQIVFLPAGLTHSVHLKRLSYAYQILSNTVDPVTMAMVILANSTNRTNCLAAPNQVGGNILDSDIDFTINSNFTGIAVSRG